MMLVNFIWEGWPIGQDQPIPDEWKAVNCNNDTVNWVDPCHPKARELIKNITEELVSNYDIDGFHFDYIRYSGEDISVSPSCKQQFEADTGITVSNWPADVCYGGQYRNEFMEWRIKSITDLVRDMYGWMVAIKPDLEFSAAVFTILYENERAYPTYQCRAIGQDPADWVRQGYLNVVNPMGYTNDIEMYKGYLSSSIRYFAGGPEGIVPVVRWTSKDVSATTPEQLKAKVEACREVGCDGWIIWKYGGPGSPSDASDIRPYLQLIDLPDTFSLGNVQAFPSSTEAIIVWTTDRPTTSKVEYSSTPLFNWSIKTDYNYQCGCDFPYWNPEHINGSIVEDRSNVTTHSITLTNLQENTTYYFRVQSQDESGIATSKVYNFTTGMGNYPVNITGTVTDSETGLPIKAIVSCNNSGNVSDVNGKYVIRLNSGGSCNLTASKFGYKTKSIPISFSGSTTYDLSLEPIRIDITGNLKDKYDTPVLAEVGIDQPGTENTLSSTQTDVNGSYNLSIRQGIYDLRYILLNSPIPNFWIELPSLNILSNLLGPINRVTFDGLNNVSFIVDDIKTKQIIQINVNISPRRVLLNGSEIGNVSSLSALKSNTWYYDSSDKKLYIKIDPYLKTDCIFECCKNETRYYDKTCPTDYYCFERICQPKTECPFECCINEEMYLNKSCISPKYCSDRKCVEYSGYWKFDEGSGSIAYDSSGLDNNGTIYGATWTIDCHSGFCLSFDGVDDYVLIPDSSSLNLDGEITLEAWVKPTGPWNGDYPGVIAKYWVPGYLLGIRNSSSTWGFWLRSNSGVASIFSDSPVEFNKWIHIAVVRDENNTMKMFINGTQQSSITTFTDSIASPGRDLEIGKWGPRYFNGTIDEVRIYNRALTADEILAHVLS
jgi:hypothetical protein